MKYAILVVLSIFSTVGFADSHVNRPHDNYILIGDFTTASPFNWDTDSVTSHVRDWSSGVVFELDQGVDVEIRDVTVTCTGGRVCDQFRGDVVQERRPLRIRFRRDLDVESITVRSKPRGFSIPPSKVNVYLETWGF